MQQDEIIVRKSCVICGHEKLEQIDRINNVPVYMGTVPTYELPTTHDLVYVKCAACSSLQLQDLLPLDLIYKANHNTEVVGYTWAEHNDRFGGFIDLQSKHQHVLEVGAPDARFLSYFKWQSWTLIEPNPSPLVQSEVALIKDWLKPELELPQKPDTVVLSHVFEHFYDPAASLDILRDYLTDNGRVVLSIPHFELLTTQLLMPPGGLHFEHTFHINLHNLPVLAERAGFKIINVEYFKEHSIFIVLEKSSKKEVAVSTIKPVGDKMASTFLEALNKYRQLAVHLNDRVKHWPGPAYIFGAHFPAQLLFNLGLEKSGLACVLDNSKAKTKQTLYGTNLVVRPANEIQSSDNPLVIVQLGSYTQEISEQLGKLNPKVVIS